MAIDLLYAFHGLELGTTSSTVIRGACAERKGSLLWQCYRAFAWSQLSIRTVQCSSSRSSLPGIPTDGDI